MKAETLRTLAQHALFVCVFLGLWEWGARAGWVDPSFMGSPLGIITFTLENFTNARLWGDLGYTLLAVFASFVIGSIAAMITGLAFVTWPKFEAFCDPYVSAFNVLPRIALVPLFILWFGLGLTLTRTLGASSRQMFFSVTLPGAVPVLFSGLRLGVIYALLGVVGAEVIASERGLGQQLAYLGSTFNVNGVWSLLFDLALIGVLIMKLMNWIERRLLHWQ
jgi:NitT/TauT family transport system permease protein